MSAREAQVEAVAEALRAALSSTEEGAGDE